MKFEQSGAETAAVDASDRCRVDADRSRRDDPQSKDLTPGASRPSTSPPPARTTSDEDMAIDFVSVWDLHDVLTKLNQEAGR